MKTENAVHLIFCFHQTFTTTDKGWHPDYTVFILKPLASGLYSLYKKSVEKATLAKPSLPKVWETAEGGGGCKNIWSIKKTKPSVSNADICL